MAKPKMRNPRLDQGATLNATEVTPYCPYPVTELGESLMQEYALRAENAAESAEENEGLAQEYADAAKISEENAKTSENAAKTSEDAAVAAADRAEQFFIEFPTGNGDIENNVAVASDITNIVGDAPEIDGNLTQSQIWRFEVTRKVDGETRLNTFTYITHFVDDVWYIQRIYKNNITGGDTGIEFSIQTDPGTKIGKIQYTSTDMPGTNYIGKINYKAERFV